MGLATNFSWEYPIPVNDFWDTLDFSVGRNFLTCFTPDELERMHLDDSKGSLDQTAKYELLLSNLKKKCADEDAKAAPQTLLDVNFDLWNELTHGMSTLYHYLGNMDEEEKLTRSLIENRKDKTNLSYFHSLSGLLRDRGRFAEAEEMEISVRDWLDGRLGPDSSQALGSRRIIAECACKQGKRTEARGLLDEVFSLVEASGKGKYAVYQDEQREMTEVLWAKFDQDDTAQET